MVFQFLLIVSMYGVFISIEQILLYRKRKKQTKQMIDDFEQRHPIKKETDG